MTEAQPHSQMVARVARLALLAGICAALLLVLAGGIGWRYSPGQFFRAWLFAWIFWLGVSLGSMGVVMMHHLVGGGWGFLVRRFGEAAALCAPVMALLFLPIIVGAKWIYPWMDKVLVNADAGLRYKHSHYLNWGFWTLRSVIVLVALTLLTWFIQTRSLERPQANASWILGRIRRVSAGGLVLYFFAMSLGSIDWIMSREPHWRSSVFGFIVCMSQAVSATCFLIMVLYWFRNVDPIARVLDPEFLNDLGNVLLTFVIMWAYLSFAQFLIIWLGNSQTEIGWYLRRTHGGWRWVGAALMLFHFLIPFLILLQRPMKRKIGRLALIAAGLFAIHIIDELYWVTPADSEPGAWGLLHWLFAQVLNVLAFIAVGGFWLTAFSYFLKNRALLPRGEEIPAFRLDDENTGPTTSPAIE